MNMNREEILRIALKCFTEGFFTHEVEEFAELVAAAEREACAKIGEDFDKERPQSNYGRCIAVAIRARGKK